MVVTLLGIIIPAGGGGGGEGGMGAISQSKGTLRKDQIEERFSQLLRNLSEKKA